MNNLYFEQKKNRQLYRELFLKAMEGFNKQINKLKVEPFCKNQKSCCKIRYADISPAEIFALSQEKDTVSEEYIKLFTPYGAGKDFDYQTNSQIDLKLNNDLALKADQEYASLILSKSAAPVYFYFCKNLQDDGCSLNKQASFLCANFPSSVTTILPKNCGFREWQKKAIDKIKNEISRDILIKLKEIEAYRQNFECKMTGTCCKLASSEFSFEELKEKASNGDNFASQFTSIFIPYKDAEEVREIFPEYIELVESQLDPEEKIYYYHCPHIGENNLCTRYEERPQICRDFPNNPLTILPPNCGFCEWKEEVIVAAMLLHSLVQITEFNLQKIEAAVSD